MSDVIYKGKANARSVMGDVPAETSLADLLAANVDEMQAKIDGELVIAVQLVKYLRVPISAGMNVVEVALSQLDAMAMPYDCHAVVDMDIEGDINSTQMSDADFKAVAEDPDVRLETRVMPAGAEIAITPKPIVIPPKLK